VVSLSNRAGAALASLDKLRTSGVGFERPKSGAAGLGLVLLLLATPASAQLGAATQSSPPEGVAAGQGAANPKGQYAALDALPDWGGIWFVMFGPPGGGKSHLASAIGLALIDNGWRVLFTRTTDLVQKLQTARRELALESALAKLDKFHLLILDDLAYVTKDQAETSVLFELISARYERRSMLITANQPFGEWGKVFPDPAMTLAAVDRLVHHATIFEMNVESYRRREAMERKRGPGRPASYATPANIVAD